MLFLNHGILSGKNRQECPGPVNPPNGGIPPTVETNGGPLTWSEIYPDGSVSSQGWNAVGISLDGSTMLAGIDWNGRLYRYSNGAWAETQPQGNANGHYNGCDLSANGSVMLTGNNIGSVYSYINSSWSVDYTGVGNKPWNSFAVSSNGAKMFAGSDGDGDMNGFTYLKSGGVWTRQWPAGTNIQKSWPHAAMSADGSKILVIGSDIGWYMSGKLYLFNGNTWSQVKPTGLNESIYWTDVAMSEDGSVMYASCNYSVFKYSSGSWSDINPTPGYACGIFTLATNTDGSKVIAVGRDIAYLYQQGSWTQVYPAGPGARTNQEWYNQTAMSGDGSKILVSSSGSATGKKGLFFGSHSITDSITQTSVKIFGRITNIGSSAVTIRGFCIGLTVNPDTSGTHTTTNGTFATGIFSEKITGLTPGTTYHARAYAANSAGISYGSDIVFTTNPVFPASLTIATGSFLHHDSVALTGNITDIGGDSCTKRGILYYTYNGTNKTLKSPGISVTSEPGLFGTGSWADTIGGRSANTKYSARSFAVNLADTAYSTRLDFFTAAKVPAAPTVSNPTATSLKVTINVNSNPSLTNFAIQDSASTKYVHSTGILVDTAVWQTSTTWGQKVVTGLTTGTIYYFRVKARNGDRMETEFGPAVSGMPVGPPTVTVAVDSVTIDSAFMIGNIISPNGGNVTSRGFIYYPYSNTDKGIGDAGVINISETGNWSTGEYMDTLTALTRNTRYNTRAVALNPYGAGYSERTDFWTLAYTPGAPSVNNPQTTSLDIRIDANSNPASTLLAIQETITGKWVRASGTLGDTASWQTEAQWEVNDTNRAKTVSGLSVNTKYKFSVKAKNGTGTETSLSSPDSLFTLASMPSAPTVNLPTTSSLNVAINANGNPAITQFAINDTVSGQYVQLDGTLGATAVWQNEVQWETSAAKTAMPVHGLSANTRYTFKVKARNGDLAETAFSGVTSLYTLANIPSPPHVFNPTANTLDISIDPNGNPAHTLFCIQDSVNNSYVQPNGTRSDLATWQTAAVWDTTTVTGLNIGGTYYFRVKGKNGNDTETIYGLTTAGTTCLNPATGGVIGSAQTICYSTTPAALTETTPSTGHAGTLEYQWQSSATGDSLSFVDITGASGTGYAPGQLTDTTWYLRLVKVTCKTDWIRSNILKITVYPDFAAGSIETTGDTICYNGDPAEIGSVTAASGGDNAISYQWQSSTTSSSTSFSDISGATTLNFNPSTLNQTTWFRRMVKDGTCHGTFTASAGVWKVFVYPLFTVGSASEAQTICEGSTPAELTGTAPSGGNTPFSYQWQTSANNLSFTDITGATTLNFQPEPLTHTTWYRLQQSSASGCGNLYTDTVAITVDPTSVGGSVSGDTLVCYGSHTSVLTLSGQTGSVRKWQYSMDDSNWNDIASHTATTYTAEDLIVDTWYRAVVQSGVCLVENSPSHKISVFTNYKISGYAKYENNPKTPLSGLKVLLRKGSAIVDSVVTTNTGYYEFDGLTNGNYDLMVRSSHPSGQWQTWGGVNNTDWLLVSKHIANTQLLPVNPPVIRTTASVKLPHPAIDNTDATAIRQAAKFPATGYTYFDTAKWVFSGTDASQALTGINLNCADVVREIRGLCSGDVNGTYVPPTGYKTAVETLHATSLQLEHLGTLPLSDEMIFPIRVDRDMEIGAITLYLDFDPSVMIVTNVTIVTDVTNVTNVTNATTATTVTNVTTVTSVTNSPDLWYNISEPPLTLNPSHLTTLQIGWMSPVPISVAEGQAVILIHAQLLGPVQTHGRASLPSSIRFTLNENPLSEFADGDGNVIDGLKLSMPMAGNSEMGNWRKSEIVVYPNPARSTLNIELETFNPEPETLRLELVNLQGVVVITREPATITAGWYKDQFNLREIAPGIYFLRANLNGETVNKKIVITR